MKIYLVVIKQDIQNCYSGLDDFHTIAFTDENEAIEHLKKEYKEYRELFKDGELYVDTDECEDYYFDINNGCDYYSGEIREIDVIEPKRV